MLLRKSRRRTPALLAANRANARKSTGPGTPPQGKSRVALNALRQGLHSQNFLAALVRSSRDAKEFRGLYRALYVAPLPDNRFGCGGEEAGVTTGYRRRPPGGRRGGGGCTWG